MTDYDKQQAQTARVWIEAGISLDNIRITALLKELIEENQAQKARLDSLEKTLSLVKSRKTNLNK